MPEPALNRDGFPEEPNLPVDSDVDAVQTPRGVPRPVHLRWEYVGLVLLGGSIGTAARYLLATVLPTWQGVPVGTFVVNIAGAFALGLMLEVLVRRGPDQDLRRILRLFVGTGILGGFTTYGSLAVETDGLLTDDQLWWAFAYAAATLTVGAVASTAGIVAGAASHGWRPTRATLLRKRHGGHR